MRRTNHPTTPRADGDPKRTDDAECLARSVSPSPGATDRALTARSSGHEVRRGVLDALDSAEGHGGLELCSQQAQQTFDALSSRHRQREEDGFTDADGGRAQRERLEDVLRNKRTNKT